MLIGAVRPLGDDGLDVAVANDLHALAPTGRRMPVGDVHPAVTSKLAPPGVETSSSVHSYSVRICHWINVVACVYLLLSGVHILLDFPELYWGHTGYRGYPAIVQALGLGPLVGGGRRARRPQVGTQLPLHRRLGVSHQRPRVRRLESLLDAFSQADAAGP